jgi:hypothetical protein
MQVVFSGYGCKWFLAVASAFKWLWVQPIKNR